MLKGFKEIKCTVKKVTNNCKSKILKTQKVAIAGGTGILGQYLTKAFLQDKSFEVIILTRKSSTNPLRPELTKNGAKFVEVDFSNVDSIFKVLCGVHIVISALLGSELDSSQSNLIKASKLAEVKRFVPSEFGVDIVGNQNPFFLPKINARKELEAAGLEYTYYVTGFFMELLVSPNYGFHLNERNIEIIGEGHTQFSITSLSDIAQFVVKTISLPQSRNATLTINGEITSMYKISQQLNSIFKTNFNINYITADQANQIIASCSVDPVRKLFYVLRLEIESGRALNRYDQTSLANISLISLENYIATHIEV